MHANGVLKYAARHRASLLFKIILDTVFPPRCLVCNRFFKSAITGPGTERLANGRVEYGQLPSAACCPECMSTFTAICAPLCTCCGMMFKSRQDENHFCGDCITQPKKFRIARAAVVHSQKLMTAVHRFKYAGKTQLAGLLGGLMLNAYQRFWDQEKFDLVLPVPLHGRKFRKRGFNQSYLLINSWKSISNPAAGELSAVPVMTDVLIKDKATVPQTGLGRQQRLNNIKGAFRVRVPRKVYAKKVLLIDDVYTTGATVDECARVLLKAGAEMVDVLTVARAL